MPKDNHPIEAPLPNRLEALLHELGADALVLEIWLHGHGGEGCRSDGPPIHLGGKHAEEDVANDLGSGQRHEGGDHEPVRPEPCDQISFVVTAKRGAVELGGGVDVGGQLFSDQQSSPVSV